MKYALSILFLSLLACKAVPVQQSDKEVTHWVAPKSLKKGDSILYIAPAGYVDADKKYMQRADSLLKLWGYIPVYPQNLYKKHFIFGGTDQERFNDLQNALDRPDIKAIWCARGGYGSVRIIDSLDFSKFEKRPKWLIGFSDITVLHSVLHQKGFQCIHALMPISLTYHNPERTAALKSLNDFFKGRKLHCKIPSDSANIPGSAKGVVVGGNLSLLVSLFGSPYQIDPAGKILFLEDVGEYTYSYDKMLYALKNAGYFDHLKALIVGGMSVKKDDDFIGETPKQLILKHVKDKNYPVIFNFPAGHIVDNRVLIFGRKAKLKVTKDTVVFEQ
ncbi:MAG TPA: LD-carboxypeptidase [Flavobacteriales bacterium]|nr:LD-carboxypeptidase [Flavobacteriales bacterium]